MGWFAVAALPPAELQGYLVNVSGYPGDRGMGTEQYHHKNRVLRVTERRVFYDVDTFGGQSGAPVWIHETDTAPPLAVGHPRLRHGRRARRASRRTRRRGSSRRSSRRSGSWVEADGGWPKRR